MIERRFQLWFVSWGLKIIYLIIAFNFIRCTQVIESKKMLRGTFGIFTILMESSISSHLFCNIILYQLDGVQITNAYLNLIVLYLYTTLYTVTRVAITDNFLPKKDLFPWGKYMLIGCLKSKFLSKFGQKTHEIYFCIILFFKNSNFA